MKKNKLSKKNKLFSWLNAKILVFIIILVVIVLANVLINIYFEADKDNHIFNISGYRNYTSYETDIKIIDCLNEEKLDGECQTIFSSPGIAHECKKIKDVEISDNCFEKAGINSLNPAYCKEIINEKVKEDCFKYSFFPNKINTTIQT